MFDSKIQSLEGQLIVSCQALPHEPLHSSFIMSRMALAAKLGGGKGIRANTVVDIMEIRKEVDLPIIGIIKQVYGDDPVFITPTMKEVDALAEISVEIIAVDATRRPRPNGQSSIDFLKEIKAKYPNQLIMGDCADLEDVELAMEYVDFVGTTLHGYTEYTKGMDISKDDFAYLKKIIDTGSKPVIAEGKVNTPEKARRCLELGAWCVVVGGAITRPMEITERFVREMFDQ